MSDEMATLIAKKFIQRSDVKAMQYSNGNYAPVLAYENGPRLPFMMSDLQNHLARKVTYGHYLIDQDDKCKLFAFDIDLEKDSIKEPIHEGTWCEMPDMSIAENSDLPDNAFPVAVHKFDARSAWLDRANPGRGWLKYQLRSVADKLARTVADEFDLPVAVAYSGAKGLHVYAFTGSVSAAEAREAAEATMALAGGFELSKGSNFFRTVNQDPFLGHPNLSIEIFPKQGSLAGKDLGNLMRLPLGRNQKTHDPTFFVDQRAPQFQLVPHPDPINLLKTGRPWL